jgi:hypothetical protein
LPERTSGLPERTSGLPERTSIILFKKSAIRTVYSISINKNFNY